jgi:hypothetical protein
LNVGHSLRECRDGKALALVVSMNLRRGPLDGLQRAVVAARVAALTHGRTCHQRGVSSEKTLENRTCENRQIGRSGPLGAPAPLDDHGASMAQAAQMFKCQRTTSWASSRSSSRRSRVRRPTPWRRGCTTSPGGPRSAHGGRSRTRTRARLIWRCAAHDAHFFPFSSAMLARNQAPRSATLNIPAILRASRAYWTRCYCNSGVESNDFEAN